MPLASTTVISLTNFPPKLPNVPPNYPTGPAPGKLQLLLNSNQTYLYHRFTPYTNYKDSILSQVLSDQQPFVYTFIDQAQNSKFNQLPTTVKGLADTVGINQDSIDDILRVSKFLISSWGVQFLISQTAIQRLASFDETRVYNPLSPILATVQPLTLGVGEAPTRHIEGGLLGLANSVTSTVGINLQSGFQTPKSTVGNGALPTDNNGQGKGLIRGGDANSALASMTSKWAPASSNSNGLFGNALSDFVNSVGNSLNAFFGNPKKSPGIYRADEQASDLMFNSKKIYLSSEGYDVFVSWFQPWYNNNTGTRPNSDTIRLWPSPQIVSNGIIYPQFIFSPLSQKSNLTINNNLGSQMPVGYTENANGGIYTDSIFPASSEQYTNSDMLIRFADYINPAKNYSTKLADPINDSVVEVNKTLQSVIAGINSQGTYNATSAVLSGLLRSGQATSPSQLGYNVINNINDLNLNTGQLSTRQEYKYGSPGVTTATVPKSIDETFKQAGGTSLRMATTFLSDGINMLGVLPNNQTINDPNVQSVYNWTEWKPYDDDLIAFFFYDVVNAKFIPFRATVKGLSAGNTAFWDELRFIGRADQLYSYNGFSRTLSFTFNVVIGSVKELLPSWKKINYLASAVKPSNYTAGQSINQKFNRFMVPPMFMLTIGDLYKFQPMVITSINVNIPDDAAWETLNEINAPKGWSYLNGLITSPSLGKNYGQLPREAEIAVTCNLLEKERAIVGGSEFGHEPRIDDWESLDVSDRFLVSTDPNTPFLPAPTTLHQGFVEWNAAGTPNTATANSVTAQQQVTPAPAASTTTATSAADLNAKISYPTPTTDGINGAFGNLTLR